MQYIMSLDQGTTSSRCILFDKSGNICSVVNKEFRQIFPQPGWVEHDANEIWDTTYEVAHAAMAKLNVKASDIAAIGITNQRETTIVGQGDGRAHCQRHCMAVPPYLRHHRPAGKGRTCRHNPAEDRPDSRRVFFRLQDPVAAGQRSRRAQAGRRGQAPFRHCRHLADLEAHRRARPRHGLYQRQPHDALQYPYPAMG